MAEVVSAWFEAHAGFPLHSLLTVRDMLALADFQTTSSISLMVRREIEQSEIEPRTTHQIF
jgi:hypothetical protein